MYSSYRIAFHEKGQWSFGNDFARNVLTFGVDNSWWFHADNRKNNFLLPGEGDTFGINGSFGVPEKKFNINFSKAKTKFCWSLHCNYNSYLFVNRKEIFKLKAYNGNGNFPTWFCLGSISNGFGATECRKVS